jgi:glycerol-3-phosphate dehydrogenase
MSRCRVIAAFSCLHLNPVAGSAQRLLNERWKGVQPVAWGDALRESEFTRWVYQGLCGLEKGQHDEI